MRTYMKSKEDRLWAVICAAAVIAAVLCVVPFIIAARYSIFHYDDFATVINTWRQSGNSYFYKSIQQMVDSYMTWQGTFVYGWVSSFFNPLRFEYEKTYMIYRLYLMAGVALTVAAAYWACFEVGKKIGSAVKAVVLCSCMVIPFTLFGDYCQIYSWFVGAANYLLPTFFLFLSVGMLFRSERKQLRWLCILACISFFLSAGGVLCIGALSACIMLLTVTMDFLDKKKLNSYYFPAFCSVVAGDLLNCLAPGNFYKYNYGHSTPLSVGIVTAVKGSVLAVFGGNAALIKETCFALFLIAAFLVGWSINRRIKRSQFVLGTVILVLTPIITMFPMMLGYKVEMVDTSSVMKEIGNRGMYCLDLAVIMSSISFAAALGNEIRTRGVIKNQKILSSVCLALAVLVLLLNPGAVKESVPAQIAENLAQGKVQNHSVEWKQIYDNMYNSPGENVVVVNFPEACVGVSDMFLYSGDVDPRNSELADYFHNSNVYTGLYVILFSNKK